MKDLVAREREVVLALLGLTKLKFEESEPSPKPGELHAVAGWRFKTADNTIEADVYVFDSAAHRQAALEFLLKANPNDGEPLVSSNGSFAFAVRYKGGSNEKTAYKARDVASALGGEEEG